jgi:hypothetical protein
MGRYNGLAGTGRTFAVDVADFIRITDGRIASNHVIVDAMTTARQLGALPPIGSRREGALRGILNAKIRIRPQQS